MPWLLQRISGILENLDHCAQEDLPVLCKTQTFPFWL